VAVFVVVPVGAVGALALLDLVTGAQSHFARNVLESHGDVSLTQTVQRRYEFAYHALVRGKMPFVFGLSVVAVVLALVYRDRLYSRLPGPSWRGGPGGGAGRGGGRGRGRTTPGRSCSWSPPSCWAWSRPTFWGRRLKANGRVPYTQQRRPRGQQ